MRLDGTSIDTAGERHGLARFIARHERALIVLWLAGCAGLLAVMAVWGLYFNGAERVVDAWDERWVARLDAAEALLETRQFERALSELEQVDADCPATFVKHRLDKQRERSLTLLGQCYAALDKKAKARATFERLVAFDPRNYANHFARAEALRAIGDGDAREAYEQVLAIHPTHLPSVAALMDMAFDAGNYAPVVAQFERYLDAWLLARIRVQCGERSVALEVPVDGLAHTLEAAFEVPEGWNGALEIVSGGYQTRVERLELEAPLYAGGQQRAAPTVLEGAQAWTAVDTALDGSGAPREMTRTSALRSPPIALASGAARVRLRIRLFKSVSDEMWTQARKAYANRLEHDLWRRVEERAARGGCLEAGSVFLDE